VVPRGTGREELPGRIEQGTTDFPPGRSPTRYRPEDVPRQAQAEFLCLYEESRTNTAGATLNAGQPRGRDDLRELVRGDATLRVHGAVDRVDDDDRGAVAETADLFGRDNIVGRCDEPCERPRNALVVAERTKGPDRRHRPDRSLDRFLD